MPKMNPISKLRAVAASRRIVSFGCMICALGLVTIMAGCSDMQFVDTTTPSPESDPREDIILTGVHTSMTSGGLVQQKIFGNHAVYSNSQSELTVKNIRVTSMGSDKATRSITEADVGQAFFMPIPSKNIGRKDMKFAGDVLYRSPTAADPTTDSMRLTSQLIIWDESQQKFKSPEGYEMMLFPKDRAPVRQSGKGFEASQDLSRFVVKAGAITTQMTGDPTIERARMEKEFDALRDEVESHTSGKPVLPTPIQIPSDMTSR